MAPSIDVARRRVRLNPRDPDFVDDPYPAYAAIREAAPAFFWEDYGFWCFARFADVSALLRDRRFGRTDRPSGLARCKTASCAVRRARAPFDAGARAARAHAAAQPRQSRLRLAPDREARAADRRPGARADRRVRFQALGRSGRRVRRPHSGRRDRRPARRSPRDGRVSSQTGRIAWSPCTSSE